MLLKAFNERFNFITHSVQYLIMRVYLENTKKRTANILQYNDGVNFYTCSIRIICPFENYNMFY